MSAAIVNPIRENFKGKTVDIEKRLRRAVDVELRTTTMKGLSERAGVAYSSLHGFVKGKGISLATAAKLWKALKLK